MTGNAQSANERPEAAGSESGEVGRPLLSLRGVTKTFGAVIALANVDFDVRAGEVVALVGDNGAGKSTLVKTISGVQPADKGEFTFDGQPVELRSVHDSSRLGLRVVYQDLALCDNLPVAANLFLGQEKVRNSLLRNLDKNRMHAEAQRLLHSLGALTIWTFRTEAGSLSGGQRQAIAIARALIGAPRIVVLDEPTAALGVTQTAHVLDMVRRLREQNLGVVLISHNLEEVFDVADRVVVLRLGVNAGQWPAESRHHNEVVAAITGAGSGTQIIPPEDVEEQV